MSRRLALAIMGLSACGGAPFTESAPLGLLWNDAGALEAPDPQQAHYDASTPADGPDGGTSGESGGGGDGDTTTGKDAGSDSRMALDADAADASDAPDVSLCCVTSGCFRAYWPVPLPPGTAGWSNDYAGGSCAPGLAGYGYCQGTVQAGACRGDY